jgi:hypothetical protein
VIQAGSQPKSTSIFLKKCGLNMLLVIVSLGFGLGVMELALRIYNPLGFRIKGDKIILPVNKNEIAHYDHSSKLDKIVYIHRNSLGFRGEEPPPDFADCLTLVTIGGSTTECLALDDTKTWPHLLGKKLEKVFQPFWFNNAGLSGNSSYGHIVLMEDYITKLKPKVALFLVGINDIGLETSSDFDQRMTKRLSLRSLESFLSWASDYSEVAAAGLNLKRYFFPKIVMSVPDQEIDLTTLPQLDLTTEQKSQVLELHKTKYLPPYAARLKKLINISQTYHIDLVFITQPAVYDRLVDDFTGVDLGKIQVKPGINGELSWELLELYNETTRKVGKENNILVIELARKLPKSSRLFYDTMHYTNEGAQKVADIIYNQLLPYLSAKYPSFH